jgi:hypothetical protein
MQALTALFHDPQQLAALGVTEEELIADLNWPETERERRS